MAKAPTDIRSLARNHTARAIETLQGIMDQPKAPPAARVAAACALLDRGWGKPNQTVDMNVRKMIAKELSDDELANIATGSGAGDTDSPVDPAKLN